MSFKLSYYVYANINFWEQCWLTYFKKTKSNAWFTSNHIRCLNNFFGLNTTSLLWYTLNNVSNTVQIKTHSILQTVNFFFFFSTSRKTRLGDIHLAKVQPQRHWTTTVDGLGARDGKIRKEYSLRDLCKAVVKQPMRHLKAPKNFPNFLLFGLQFPVTFLGFYCWGDIILL